MRKLYSRQILLTTILILLALLVAMFVFQNILYRYLLNVTQQSLTQTADTASGMMQVLGTAQQNMLMYIQLNYTARVCNNDLLLCSTDGTVLACSCGMQSCSHVGQQLDIAALTRDDPSTERLDALYGEKRLSATAPVNDMLGMRSGYVVVSQNYDICKTVMRHALRMNLITILMIFPMMILFVCWLIHRQNKPIKQLTQAATQLRHGQFSARVPTDSGTAETEELAVAFNNMAQALEQSDRKRQEFVANVSHELKTPMTTISSYMDGMLDGTIPEEQHPKYMRVISDEVKRLSRLVRNMLDISKLQETTVPEEQKHRFDLCETVGQTLIGFEQKIIEKQLAVETELPPEGAPALANPDAIGQVIYNLVENAVKFCPEKGLLRVELARTDNQKYLLTVTNDGPTIPPEELPLVFERFHKADKSRSEDREGWGLGLYIVNSIIRSHGEDIFVTSRDGKTAFSFTVQMAEM